MLRVFQDNLCKIIKHYKGNDDNIMQILQNINNIRQKNQRNIKYKY